jgi:CAAX prenyl protease-like protein
LDALRGAIPASGAQGAGGASYWGSAWLPLKIAGSVCVVPLVEELAFRGYLMRRLTSAQFESVTAGQVSILAWAISAVLFGVLHEHWFSGTLAGAIFGFAYMRRGQLFDCIVAHAFTNLLLVVLALSTEDWSLF